jgi:hypothetical protein
MPTVQPALQPTVLKIADRVSHARSMVFALFLLLWLVTEKKAIVSPMHRWVARMGDNEARPDMASKAKMSFMVHGPVDVKTKTPTVQHRRRCADPPFQMLFIARGTRLTLRQGNPSRVELHAPTSVFAFFRGRKAHK